MSLFWEIEKRDHRNHDIDVDIAAVYNHQCSFPCNCSHLLFRNFHEVVGYYLVVIVIIWPPQINQSIPFAVFAAKRGLLSFPKSL